MPHTAEHSAGGDGWSRWPVYWDAVWVGALASLAAVVLFGFVGTALGAYRSGNEARITSWSGIGLTAIAFAVFGSFLSFALGGWVAAKIAGLRRAEPAMLHGAITFLAGVALLLLLAAIGGSYFSGWYVQFTPTPAAPPATPGAPVDPNLAKAAAAGATAAAASMLLGLMGGVIGGWAGSGEPMTLTHHRTRTSPTARQHTVGG